MIPFAGHLYLDCCSLLNIYATRRFDEILIANRPSASQHCVVARRVRDEEALFVRSGPGDEREQVNLEPSIGSGALLVEGVQTDEESATFVALAAVLDDGEAETGALAYHRSGAVATDDAAAIRVLALLKPAVFTVRTSTLMKRWAESGNPAPQLVRQALNDIRERARFVPGPSDPLRKWWFETAA